MKTFIFLFLACTLTLQATAQSGQKPRSTDYEKIDAGQVPAAVLSAFANANPGIIVSSWEKHRFKGKKGNEFTNYIASYDVDGTRARARYNQDGSILLNAKSISAQNLPGSISNAATTKHPDFTLMGGDQLVTKKGETYYRVRLRKGSSAITLLYDSNGSEVSRSKQTQDLHFDEGEEK
jgi:hypothetical protein